MKKITFLTLFISLILGACGDEYAMQARIFTTQLLKDNNKTLYRKAYILKDSIFQEIELKYRLRQGSTRAFVVAFDEKYDSLSNSLSNKWSPPKSGVDWKLHIADWKRQALNFHQYFSDLFKIDSVSAIEKLPASFKQKIDDSPRALAQIERELLANPKSKEYWFRYTESLFNLWRVDLYQTILNQIVTPASNDYYIVAYPDYNTFPKVGKPHPIIAFVTTKLVSTQNLGFEVSVFGKKYNNPQENQITFKARPTKTGEWLIPISCRVINPLTGEHTSFYKSFYPTVNP